MQFSLTHIAGPLRRQSFSDRACLRMQIEFGSEAAASTFVHKYQDVVLDGVALDVRTRGVAVPAYLKSGVRVSTKQQPGRQGENGAPPRGRGSSGRMRSDRMDE